MPKSPDDAPPRSTRRPRTAALQRPASGQLPSTDDDDAQEPLPGGPPAPELEPHGDALLDGDDDGAEGRGLPARGGAAPLRLLRYYDRLRDRIAKTVARRGGRLGKPVAEALLLVPDVFMLLARLAFDREVPRQTRTLIGGALAYFVLPVDLLPEAMLGPAGYVDDLVLAVAVLTQAMSADLEERVRLHWSGSDDVRRVLQDVSSSAHSLLGEDLFARMGALLARRGVVLEASAPRGGGKRGGRAKPRTRRGAGGGRSRAA